MLARTKPETIGRTDTEILKDLRRIMKTDREVPDDRIEVKVVEGIVTIEGTVARDSQKQAAELCAGIVKGVHEVINNILVEPAVGPVEA